ncbi:energy transducer TonB [Hyalangium gracile]|uniref:energy transducer TonB n=1 Tax=Hyalangium gracile TaxID=394092 RepID=UPI001CCC8F4B|nr:energy transducer TonB [Hyalangium gracile]
MFQSVIDQQEWRARRLGTGAGVSLLVHAGLFAAVMVISAGVAEKVKDEDPVVVFKHAAPPRGTPNPPAVKAVAEQPKPKPRPNPMVQPTVIPQKTPVEVEPTTTKDEPAEPSDDTGLPYDPNGKPDGLAGGTCVTCEALKGAMTTVMEPTGEETLPFSFGTMTPPRLLSGAHIEYTREAREAHVSGTLIAKCVITREGEVEKCRIIKGVTHMNEAVLAALETRRYSPVQYQGKPVSVSYNFHIKLDMAR